jgi:hypothetical protein
MLKPMSLVVWLVGPTWILLRVLPVPGICIRRLPDLPPRCTSFSTQRHFVMHQILKFIEDCMILEALPSVQDQRDRELIMN